VEEHPLRHLSRTGVLFKCRLLLEEDPPDLVQSFLWAITLMTLLSTLVRWFWLGRLFAQRVNVKTKDCVTSVGFTWLPQLPFQSSLVQQSIFVPRTQTASYPTDIRTFNLSVGDLDKLKLFRKHMEAFDMFDPFLIPTWIDPDAISVLDCWGDRNHDGIDLTKH
jgi:hypothetical protein